MWRLLVTSLVLLVPRAAWAIDAQVAACLSASEEGQRLRDEGRYQSARTELAKCVRVECPVIVRHDCAEWLAQIERRTPSVVFVARDGAGSDIRDVRVRIDGNTVAERLDGRAQTVDPGEHVVAFEHGGTVVERHVIVNDAEKDRILSVVIEGARPTKSADASEANEGRPRKLTLPFTLAGVAAVGLGVFAYVGATAKGDLSQLERSPCATTRTCSPSEVDGIHTRYLIADVALIAGLASLAASTWLFLRSPAHTTR